MPITVIRVPTITAAAAASIVFTQSHSCSCSLSFYTLSARPLTRSAVAQQSVSAQVSRVFMLKKNHRTRMPLL